MKVNVRGSVWETNSSMTHSMVILPREKYDEWKTGLYLYVGSYSLTDKYIPKEKQPVIDNLYTLEEAQNFISMSYKHLNLDVNFDDFTDRDYADEGFCTFNAWSYMINWDEENYTTESGEELVIRCKYGYDG